MSLSAQRKAARVKAASNRAARTAALVEYGRALAAWVPGSGPRPVDPRSSANRVNSASSPWRKGKSGAQHSTWATELHVGRR